MRIKKMAEKIRENILENTDDTNKNGAYDVVNTLQALINILVGPTIMLVGISLIVIGTWREKPELVEAGYLFAFGGAYKTDVRKAK